MQGIRNLWRWTVSLRSLTFCNSSQLLGEFFTSTPQFHIAAHWCHLCTWAASINTTCAIRSRCCLAVLPDSAAIVNTGARSGWCHRKEGKEYVHYLWWRSVPWSECEMLSKHGRVMTCLSRWKSNGVMKWWHNIQTCVDVLFCPDKCLTKCTRSGRRTK